MQDRTQQIVERMIAAGESEQDIAAVIQQLKPVTSSPRDSELHPHARVGKFVTNIMRRENWPMIGGAGGALLGGIPGAALGGAVGKMAQMQTDAVGGKEPESVPAMARDIGVEGAIQGGIEGVGRGAPKAIKAGAELLYRGVLKPSLAATNAAKAPQIVKTLIRERVPITRGGVAKVDQKLAGIKGAADAALDASSSPVDLARTGKGVREWAQSKFNKPGVPVEDLRAALDVADNIDLHPSLGLPPGVRPTRLNVMPRQANEVKRSLQKSVGAGYGLERDAAKEARKQGGLLLRRDIEAAVPEVGPLNEQSSQMIDALKSLKAAVERNANNNQLLGVRSLGAATVGGTTYAADGDPLKALAAGLGARAIFSPGTTSRMAIRSHQAADAISPNAIRASLLALLDRSGK